MWAGFRNSFIKPDKRELKEPCRSLNVNEEYLRAFRTKSYADFFDKAQTILVNNDDNHDQASFLSCKGFPDNILLEPGQETILSILESASFLSKKSDLKALFSNYFDISAEASKICSHLLRSINQLQSNHQLVKQVVDTIDNFSPKELGFIVSDLSRLIFVNNPLSDFTDIHDKYSETLHHLKSTKKKILRKIKLVRYFNKVSGACFTTACAVTALGATVLAAHTVVALVMGPVILGAIPVTPLKKKILNVSVVKCGFWRKIWEQLDVAAKGTYILNRDFDTISRLVTRLYDEVEHSKAMMQCFLDRRDDKRSLQILMMELRKNDFGFRKQVEELEEHVYLSLVTINRARALVVNEIANSS